MNAVLPSLDFSSWVRWKCQTLDRLLTGKGTTLADLLWARPGLVLERMGMLPDPWQARVLASPAPRTLLLCSRQSGKSQTAAGLVLLTALREPGSLTLILSPGLRQSGEFFRAR